MLSPAARNGSREALPSPCISYGHHEVRERLMQGALHAVIGKGIPDRETDGVGREIILWMRIHWYYQRISSENFIANKLIRYEMPYRTFFVSQDAIQKS